MWLNLRNMGFLIMIMSALCSCSTTKLDSYINPSYSAGQYKKVVVFPISNARLSVGHANELCKSFSQSLLQKNPNLEVVGADEVIRKLNEADLTDEWTDFLNGFSTSGIPNTKTLNEIGTVLRVDAIIQGSIVNITQEDSDGFSYPVTRVSVRYTMFSVKDGAILWELTGEGIIRPYSYTAVPIIDALKLAHAKILDQIPF